MDKRRMIGGEQTDLVANLGGVYSLVQTSRSVGGLQTLLGGGTGRTSVGSGGLLVGRHGVCVLVCVNLLVYLDR